jgi:hypothetical protein
LFGKVVGVPAFLFTCGARVAAPAVFVVPASFGEDAEEADLAVEYAAYVGGSYVGVVP